MSNSSLDSSGEDKRDSDEGNVFQVGFNISLSGSPSSGFQVLVNEKGAQVTPTIASSLQALPSSGQISEIEEMRKSPKLRDEKLALPSTSKSQEVKTKSRHEIQKNTGAIPKRSKNVHKSIMTSHDEIDSSKPSKTENKVATPRKDATIIDEIKSAMGNFEKFSEHLKTIPRFSHRPVATSTPFPHRCDSRSEGNLTFYEDRARKQTPRYDFRNRSNYISNTGKNLHSDLFLKPLPAEDYFKKSVVTRCFDLEPYRHYGSVDTLTRHGDYNYQMFHKSKSDSEKWEGQSSGSDYYSTEPNPPGILKKTDSENIDKQSTSSTDSVKDIKIYQSGGILIMQNFNENMDLIEKKDISELSAKLIENCSKLKDEIQSANLQSSDDCQKPLISTSSDDVKGKTVQFDLSGCENPRLKSSDSSSKFDSSPSKNDLPILRDYNKARDNLHYVAAQNQDFPSLSTQENDSLVTVPGMSPTSSTSGKKLEWDSGADVGYLNLDLTKENLSTIERIILKGLSNDGKSEKKVVYEKKPEEQCSNRSRFILERKPSEIIIEEIGNKKEAEEIRSEEVKKPENGSHLSSSPEQMPKSEAKKKAEEKSNEEHEDNSSCKMDALKKKKTVEKEKIPKNEENHKKTQTRIEFSKQVKETQADSESEKPENRKNPDSESEKPENRKKIDSESEKPENRKKTDVEKQVESKSVQTRSENSEPEEPAPPLTSDKSTNVDTLFIRAAKRDDAEYSDASDKYGEVARSSPRVKKLKKKKQTTQSGNLTARLKDKIDNIIDIARSSNRAEDAFRSDDARNFQMGIPKRIHRKFDAKNCTNELELSQDYEEIIIDQRFKIKQNVAPNRDGDKSNLSSAVSEERDAKAEKKPKVRPVSASSGSNATVLPNTENQSGVRHAENQSGVRYADQIVQTNEYKYESKGIQAFESRKASISFDSKDGSSKNKRIKKETEIVKRDTDIRMTSSKNIQASGVTSSLPKHLEHPKEVSIIQNQNTKSTQFFGGLINSLPNYHSNLITKTNESCSRMPKILKTNSVRDNNRANRKPESVVTSEVLIIKERHESENKSGRVVERLAEDKENTGDSLRVKKTKSDSNKSDFNKSDSNKSAEKKKEIESTDGTEFQSSDDVKSKVLTSQLLKEHGDSVDRSIIQEKYFQSQLVELERNMVSRSTSMERHLEHERNTQTTLSFKKAVTVGCQYSPQRKKKAGKEKKMEGKSEEKTKGKDNKVEKEKPRKEISTDQYDSSQNMIEDERFGTLESTNQDQGFGTIDSMPSSTQTAHSWVPGMQDALQSKNSAVGRARSFEYLPGHIYESSGNLREELPSETERNLISGSTSGSSQSVTSKPSSSDGIKESEGRNTLVLENADRSSSGSDQTKNLGENLAELEIAMSKFGSGDWRKRTGVVDVSNLDSQKTRKKPVESVAKTSEESCKWSEEEKPKNLKKSRKSKQTEISTACQTEWRSPASDSERFYQEKKELERRIDEEKENQIKWIENEIQHLNILRGLLEKQDDLKLSNSRKKKSPEATVTKEKPEIASSLDEFPKTVFAEVYPKETSPSSALGNSNFPEQRKPDESVTSVRTSQQNQNRNPYGTEQLAAEIYGPEPDLMRYGMKVSVTGGSNHLRHVTMMPVGVQVTLKDKKAREECFNDVIPFQSSQYSRIQPFRSSSSSLADPRIENRRKQVDIDTQYPSLSRGTAPAQTTSTQVTDSLRYCSKCNQGDCVCDAMQQQQRRSENTETETTKPKQVKVIDDEEFCRSIELIDVDLSSESIRNTENKLTTSECNNSEDQKESSSVKLCDCSEFSEISVKCTCKCHEKPLPRCKGCNLLNTCKKCNCYGNLKGCECAKQCRKCLRLVNENKKCCRNCTVCANCQSEKLSSDDKCETCGCSKLKQQNCILCSCHSDNAKSKTKELERDLCKCHERNVKYFGKCKCEERKKSQHDECACPCCDYFRHRLIEFGENVKKSREAFMKQFQTNGTRTSSQDKTMSESSCNDVKTVLSKPPENELRPKIKEQNGTIDGHPRHYFLKIEETEDDSIETFENRKSVEVITVKVPVRKLGKAKKYGRAYEEKRAEYEQRPEREPSENDDYGKPFRDVLNRYRSTDCTCSRCRHEERHPEKRNDYFRDGRSENSRPFQDLLNRCRRKDDGRNGSFQERDFRIGEDRAYFRRDDRRNDERPPTQGCQERDQEKNGSSEYFNYNKREFMTKSELEKEKKKKEYFPTLQECLATNRPDFYNSAEFRRHIISERAREREEKHNKRVRNLAKLMAKTEDEAKCPHGQKRIFTTSQMKEQTMKRYKQLSEVTEKKADRKKKEEYRTNKLMADIFAKRLQSATLKGHVNLSNSVSVLSSI